MREGRKCRKCRGGFGRGRNNPGFQVRFLTKRSKISTILSICILKFHRNKVNLINICVFNLKLQFPTNGVKLVPS